MSTALTPIPPNTVDKLRVAQSAAMKAFTASTSSGTVDIASNLAVAESVVDLRALFDTAPIQQRILSLCNTKLGFRTDTDPTVWSKKLNGYPKPLAWPVVRDAAVEACVRGLQLVGNQFNIIAGNFYCTQEGFSYLISQLGDITDVKINLGVPRSVGEAGRERGCLVDCDAAWFKAGKPDRLEASIPVKADEFSTADQLLGKATRKLLARAYKRMTGRIIPEGDAAEQDIIEVGHVAQPDAKKLFGQAEAKEPKPPKATKSPPASTAGASEPVLPAQQESLLPETLKKPSPFQPRDRLKMVIESMCTWSDFLEVLHGDGQTEGYDPAKTNGVYDLPIEIVNRYVGADGNCRAAIDGIKFVLDQRQ